MSIYLKIDNIQGDVTTKGYEKCIAIHEYVTESERRTTNEVGSSALRTLGPIRFNSLELIKPYDIASIDLTQAYLKAKVLPKLVFSHVSTGDKPKCYLEATFHQVLISKIETLHSESSVMETLSLQFAKFERKFTGYDQTMAATSPKAVGYCLTTCQTL